MTARDIGAFVLILLAIVIPTCISETFCNYVSPLYIKDLDLSTNYIGRVSLVYNLCIVYVSSRFLLRFVKKIKSRLVQNIVHMLLIASGLIVCASWGGYGGLLVAAAILGSGDGFGFSVQSAYILESKAAQRIGSVQMFTYFSVFKKFGAMLGPVVFSLYMSGGPQGLAAMGILFLVCAGAALVFIPMLQKSKVP